MGSKALRIISRFNNETQQFEKCRMKALKRGDLFKYERDSVQFMTDSEPYIDDNSKTWAIKAFILPVIDVQPPGTIIYLINELGQPELCGVDELRQLPVGSVYKLSTKDKLFVLTEPVLETANWLFTVIGKEK